MVKLVVNTINCSLEHIADDDSIYNMYQIILSLISKWMGFQNAEVGSFYSVNRVSDVMKLTSETFRADMYNNNIIGTADGLFTICLTCNSLYCQHKYIGDCTSEVFHKHCSSKGSSKIQI